MSQGAVQPIWMPTAATASGGHITVSKHGAMERHAQQQ